MAVVALVFGGPSGEHDVSLVSAKNILTALQKTSHDVLTLGITKDQKWKMIRHGDLLETSFADPIDLTKLGTEVSLCRKNDGVYAIDLQHNQVLHGQIDVAFPICHGPYGEDGRLQGFFDIIGLPYVGSSTASCAVAMDKTLTKATLAITDVPQVPYMVSKDPNLSFADVCQKLTPPVFVKPANMGSSVGINKANDQKEFSHALQEALQHDSVVVIEQGVDGKEIECAVMEKDGQVVVSNTGEIIVHHDFYSYAAKYLDPKGAEFVYPANINEETKVRIKKLASQAFTALGCRHYARADFFVYADDKIYFNEINTHPGFTKISQFPKLWEIDGINNTELVEHLLQLALKDG